VHGGDFKKSEFRACGRNIWPERHPSRVFRPGGFRVAHRLKRIVALAIGDGAAAVTGAMNFLARLCSLPEKSQGSDITAYMKFDLELLVTVIDNSARWHKERAVQ
jgi:hypothetical protein